MCQSVLSVLSEPVVVYLAGAGRSRAVLCIPALATSQGNPRVLVSCACPRYPSARYRALCKLDGPSVGAGG